MKIYFKFLNDYILLDNEQDNISGDLPMHFIEFIDTFDQNINNGFIKIQHNGVDYFVHISNIQWCC